MTGRSAVTAPKDRDAIDDVYPLTPMQQGMLFHTLMAPGTGVYVEQLSCRIGAGLDIALFEQALQQLVDHHPVMRTVFAWEKLSEPMQIVHRRRKVDIVHLDWSERSRVEQDAAFAALLEDDYQRGFKLSKPPLVRFTLIRFGKDDARLVWTSHHILTDGWSFAMLMSEFMKRYAALTRGEATVFAPVRPYRDYIAWLKQRDVQATETFWRKTLAGFSQPVPLGVDRPDPRRVGVRKAPWRMSEGETVALREWTRRHGVTMNTLVQGIWAILLAHYSQQTDIVFGATVSGRPAEIEQVDAMVGLFINTLPVRVHVDCNAPFVGWLDALQRHNAEMRGYDYTPLTQIRAWSELGGNTPFFHSIVVFENYPIDDSLHQSNPVLDISDVHLREQDNSPLTLSAALTSHLEIDVNYDAAYFDDATIARLGTHLTSLFRSVLDASTLTRVSELRVLDTAARDETLRRWNASTQPYEGHRTLRELFADQVARTPAARAVEFGDASWTYAQLDRRAETIAAALRRHGVGPDAIVALRIGRSLDMVAAVFGVWKAGGAYLPLDPNWPHERVNWMISDAKPTLLMTERAFASGDFGLTTLLLEDVADHDGDAPGSAPIALRPDHAAYVIYTSGSTGRPKGTLITQRSTVNMAASHAAITANVVPGTLRVACNTAISFDVSVSEFTTLLYGHTLVIVPEDVRLSPEALLAFIEAKRIDAIDCPVSQLRQMLEHSNAAVLPRYLSVGGDAVDAALWRTARALPRTRCFNFYGPTECTVDVTIASLREAGEIPVIGTPQQNTRLFVLDARLQPVAPGVTGQLYVAGDCLARGYLNRPALTAERFVPNPHALQPGERMYRTGDLARHLTEGSIEFVGRVDDQLKIRGYRIEPGEIENTLAALPAVREVLVLPRETEQGDRQLVAYVAIDADAEQMRYWGQQFDEIYDSDVPDDAAFNTTGWNSSYDRVPIPADEMRAWLDSTLARILALEPQRVLEIGCGTGMILHGIAPHCVRYHGTDLSARVIGQLQTSVDEAAYDHCDIRLSQRGAHDLHPFRDVGFDTIVINSVAQYFPSTNYLFGVIEAALETLGDTGHIFLGDIRHGGLLRVFHTSLELYKAQPSTLLARMRESVARIEEMETELLIDPAFFFALQRRYPAITHVAVDPKEGDADNELTVFRYDVVLTIGLPRGATDRMPLHAPAWQDRDAARPLAARLAAIEAALVAGVQDVIAHADLPDARLAAHIDLSARLHADCSPLSTVEQLRRDAGASPVEGVARTALSALARRHGYDARFSFASGSAGTFHAVFSRLDTLLKIDWRARFSSLDATPHRIDTLANKPSSRQRYPMIQKQLVQRVRERLPEYMMPGRFVLLDALPRGIHGKIDRLALSAPNDAMSATAGAARTPVEEILTGIWTDILGVPSLDPADNFFELGGHSLLATRVVSKVRSAFQADLPIRALFEAPTVRDFAHRIELAQREQAGTNLSAIEPRRHDGALPLAFAQQRLWFIDRLEPSSALYNMPAAVQLSGRLDVDALQRTLDEIVARHASLRTTFTETDGVPWQRIAAKLNVSLEHADLRGLDVHARDTQAVLLTREETNRPFDLAFGPLIRGLLIRTGDTEHVAVLTLHHAIADGWSIGVLIREIGLLYAAFVQKRRSPLPPLAIQYADFAVWQREWLADGVLQRQLSYWKDALADAPTLLPIPTDRPRPPQRAYRGQQTGFVIDAALTGSLKALCRRSQTTLFMALMAAFDVLLARYSGETDICVGTAVANRNRAETEALIGLFVNTLVMRQRVDASSNFLTLLGQVRSTALKAYANQDVPFEHVVEAVAPVRSLSHQPLFQVMLLMQNTPGETLALPGLSLNALATGNATAKCDLMLSLTEGKEDLYAVFEYDTDLFDKATIVSMGRHYTQLLRAIVAAPDARLATLPMLDDGERQRLVDRWSASKAKRDATPALIPMFEAQVATAPDRIAIESGELRLSYRELNAAAASVAHSLDALSVRPADLVCVLTDRSEKMMQAVLGVMKTGAAYLPLDVDAGLERLSFMVRDARPKAIVTQRALLDTALAIGMAPETIVCVDEIGASAKPFHGRGPIAAESLAYLIYTSGSTGTPKAVQVTQRNLTNLLLSMQREPGIVAGDVMLSVTSLAFDLVVPNLFLPLICGASTIYAPRELTEDPARLAALMERHQPTLMQATPSTWHMLVEHRWPVLNAPLKLLCGGDTLSSELLVALLKKTGAVWNMYGPTETTVWSAMARLDGMAREAWIDRPLDNTRLYVMDETFALQPFGVIGELCIAGDGLARGYLNRFDLTAERFVPDPFGAPGTRMYRSGDRVRQLPDGSLEYLGRIDTQVKLRGFRIETGEIEAVLREHPGVGQCVVTLRGDGEAARLVAYVTRSETGARGSDATESLAASLRAHLLARLPHHMVPAAFVALAALPLTSNGKIDRRALPEPDASALAAQAGAPPCTDIEFRLAALWRKLLDVPDVSRDDDFFSLGGHSLLATRLVSRIRQTFGCELPLRTLFETPVLAELALRIEAAGTDDGLPVIPRAPREPAPPLSFAQQRLWFIDQMQPGSSVYNIPAALRLDGEFDRDALSRTFAALLERHEVLRTRIVARDGVPTQLIESGAAGFALDVLDLSNEADPDARALDAARAEAVRPFDLADDLPLRACLLRLAPTRHVVLLTLHHIASDGWSMGVIVREVTALYGALREGRPSPLAPLPLQYADYAAWQRNWLAGDRLDRQVRYWSERLAGAPALLTLPTDHPRPAIQRHDGALFTMRLDVELVDGLQRLAAEHGATLFMALAAGFALLLGRHAAQDDVCLGTPIANRTRAELEPLVGFFVNTLVLRIGLDAGASFAGLLAQTRDTALAAYAHQDVPFEQLVEALRPERHLSHSPLFQAMIALQNAPTAALHLPGLDITSLPAGDAVHAKFDLSLYAETIASGELTCTFEYRTDLFERGSIEQLAARYAMLLAAAVADPERRARELPMMGDAEKRALSHLHAVTPSLDDTPPLHIVFSRQAALTPERIAVDSTDRVLTYAELDARSDTLAQALRRRGVRPDGLVGVCLPRSCEAVIAILGILKAGGAYLPLDPDYPRQRIAFMIEDARPSFIVTTPDIALAAGLPQALCMDVDASQFGAAAYAEALASARPYGGNLAYVIYTSGSTGVPKGVAISHASAASFIAWSRRTFSADVLHRVLCSTSLCFDLSVFELFAPLATGGAAVMVDDVFELDANPVRFADLTLINTVPSAIAALERSNAIPASVRVINLAGEALPNPLVQTLYRRPSLEQVYNLYGPTEDTTYSTYTSIPRGASTPCPIGGPIAGTRAHVVDGGLAEVPIGVSGELCLAGDGLARGYLNRPALTAERFVPNPFGAAGERMYRTGDLVQRRPDGSLNYLGRIDTQIKLRGFRIELGEIETALRAHPAVTECAVIVRGNGEEAQLLAYFAPQTVAIDALRAHLSGTLPNYMVPSVFMPVARLPLTSNGKLDRKALPECDATAASSRFGEAPRGDLEQRLANIWQQLLHVAHVSRSDNFFVIGGHSLLATRLVSQIRDTFGRELPLRALFETPILAELAERLRAGDDTAPSEPLIMPITRDAALPLSFAQQRLWFIDQMQPGSALYNMPVALQLDGALDVDALSRTLAALLARHEALRTRIVAHDGVPLQIVDPAPLHFALDVVDLSHHPEPDVCALDEARAEAGRPFDLANGPLLRARLLKLAPIRHVMLLTVHHIASDGWSMGVLVREFVALYPALRDGLPSPLAASALQYADYAAWQRAWLGGARLDAQLHYWSERLAGAPRLLSLPTDHPRPPTQDYDGAFHTFRLDAALTASLEALATEHRATMFMVLSAAFALVLGRHAGQDEVCLGTPVANRTRSEVENLVGCFVNTLVLRIGLDPKASFADLLIQTRETALAAYAHQDVPFEQLVDVLQVERDPSHTPLFQASIVLQNAHTEALRVPGIDIVPLPMAGTTSKFDLTLFAEPQASGALSCSLEYRTALFSADTIVRLGAHLTTLLQAVASDAQQRILVLPMLSGCERDDLERWRTRAVDLSQGADAGDAATTLGERFALQVALTPERIAIACGNESLTYADLDRQATRLAAQLRRAGAGPDRLVAVLAERSVWLPLAFVAVLKAGAVYLPLDPEHPSERHAATIDDARPVALLTQRRFAADSPLPTLPIVCMDDGAVDEPDTHEHATAKVFPDHLAYMIYTSGSTGKPKGAMISHRATVNLLDGLCREIYGVERFDASRRLTLNASAAFDASLQQLVMLCAGATLLPVPTDVRRDPARLLAFLASERIDVFDCTPQQLAALLAFAPHAPLPAHILTGGEAIEPGLWQSLRKHAGTRVHNLYGPTECTVDAITARLDASVTPLIGAPLPNVSAAVLNTALEPVPAGVTGELYLGGPGLARGYFRRPDLTAESFMPDPSGPPGARRYRTGDLVRHRRDGTLDFVGRADTQIKLRGFRIEPAEIEAALTEMDGIVEALVLASEGPAGQAMLIAWIVSERGAARPDTAMLLAALRKRLPYYMVPAAVVPLERMPLTPGGKVDRRALPPPTFAAGRHFSPPATQTEQRIATIWAEVLGIAQIGRDDSFFDLGGNSLSAVQLVSRMERATGIALPLHVLFEEPTIVGIARAHAALQDLNDHEADTGPLDSAELLI